MWEININISRLNFWIFQTKLYGHSFLWVSWSFSFFPNLIPANTNKGWPGEFLLLSSIEDIQHLVSKTNQFLINIISLSCQYMSVHILEQIKFQIWLLLTAQFNVSSLKKSKMAAASHQTTLTHNHNLTMHSKLFQKNNLNPASSNLEDF